MYTNVKYALGTWIGKEEFHLSEDANITLRDVLTDPDTYFDTLNTDAVKKLAKFDTKLAEQIFEHLEDMYYSGRHTDTWEQILKKRLNRKSCLRNKISSNKDSRKFQTFLRT